MYKVGPNQIFSLIFLVFVIWFIFNGYWILIFDLLQKLAGIELKRITNIIKFTDKMPTLILTSSSPTLLMYYIEVMQKSILFIKILIRTSKCEIIVFWELIPSVTGELYYTEKYQKQIRNSGELVTLVHTIP